jgi:NAD(P)-dependent dehydrogenase (short-subunit alcohol dehydrogenase family)
MHAIICTGILIVKVGPVRATLMHRIYSGHGSIHEGVKMRLADRVAIVTGGGSSIGLAVARRLASEGASIVIADIVQAESAAEELLKTGHQAIGIKADVSSEEDVSRMMAKTIERFGKVDILINNAAISKHLSMTPFEMLTVADWKQVLEVNTIGTFICCRAAAPHMRARKYGRIVNFSSGTAFKGTPFMLHYVASKGAIISMTRSLARELGPDNITINAISPGYILSAGSRENPGFMEKVRPVAIATRSLPRDGFEEDLLGSISFLASDESAFVTGQVLAVDGGSVYH